MISFNGKTEFEFIPPQSIPGSLPDFTGNFPEVTTENNGVYITGGYFSNPMVYRASYNAHQKTGSWNYCYTFDNQV